jgi:hypothetical protein
VVTATDTQSSAVRGVGRASRTRGIEGFVPLSASSVISKELALDDQDVPRRIAFGMIPYCCTGVCTLYLHEYSVYILDFVLRTSYSVHRYGVHSVQYPTDTEALVRSQFPALCLGSMGLHAPGTGLAETCRALNTNQIHFGLVRCKCEIRLGCKKWVPVDTCCFGQHERTARVDRITISRPIAAHDHRSPSDPCKQSQEPDGLAFQWQAPSWMRCSTGRNETHPCEGLMRPVGAKLESISTGWPM